MLRPQGHFLTALGKRFQSSWVTLNQIIERLEEMPPNYITSDSTQLLFHPLVFDS
jgi:hypothetical protein